MEELKSYLKDKEKIKLENNLVNESIGIFSLLLKNWKTIKIELIRDKINWEILSALKK